MNADKNDENPPLKKPQKVNESNKIVDEIVSAELVSSGEPEIESPLEASVDEAESSIWACLLYTSPSPRDLSTSRMPSSA